MNRRDFTKSLAAAFAIPALPMPSIAAAHSVTVSNAARFWAIYMTRLHGDVTPGMLTQMTGLDPVQTTAIRTKLLADKVITPTGFVRKGIASQTVLKSKPNMKEGLSDLKNRVLDLVDEQDPTSFNEAPELTESQTPPIDIDLESDEI